MSGAALTPDLCVIGAGAGGLSVASGAAQLGVSVVLVEGGEMGGDCLNSGCVPSKALLAAAAVAHGRGDGAGFGVGPERAQIDAARVRAHVREVIAGIAPHDSQERFEGLGVHVIRDWARFADPRTIVAGAATVRPRRIVLATGGAPAIPPIPGLPETPHLTNETLFELPGLPASLIVLGGGPIGMEMAQAHARLGVRVTLLEAARALGREDEEAAALVVARLRAEGVDLREGARVASVAPCAAGVAATLEAGARIEAERLLVATGRRPALDRLDPAAGGVEVGPQGVIVDRGLRSVSNRRVYAIGDAAGPPQFTHRAGHHAGLVIRSALFRLPVRAREDHIPRVTFTDPPLAQIGLTEAEARATHGAAMSVARADYAGNDRARAMRAGEGFAKAVIGRRGRILGATVVGAQADELIQPWALAMSAGLKIGAVAGMVAPYPTLGEVNKRAASAHFAPRLFESTTIRAMVQLLAKLG
ncbi:MAG: NAD(P)/FAD-dependent oxidoreductase [Rubrimonas sp.]|uniref:dihydrolipoyl dehydrogenase family protein n=1 Tax=Rubrimonas sp. TaxID=2036015 RepID=UPI002FDDC38A